MPLQESVCMLSGFSNQTTIPDSFRLRQNVGSGEYLPNSKLLLVQHPRQRIATELRDCYRFRNGQRVFSHTEDGI